MFLKSLPAAAASAVMLGSTLISPLCANAVQTVDFQEDHLSAEEAHEEYLCRDFHNLLGNQHYMDKYNTAVSEHFQIFWGNDDQTDLINPNFIQINLDQLELYRDLFMEEYGMKESSESVFTPDGKKYKTNIYLTRTGLPDFEEGWAFMSAEPYTGFAYLFCDPGAMLQENGMDS